MSSLVVIGCSATALGEVFEAARDQQGPALKAGTEAAPGVAVEVLVEHDVVTEVRVGGKQRIVTVEWAPAARVGQKEAGQTTRQLAGDRFQGHPAAGAGRALDLQRVAVEVVIALQGLDKQVVDWWTTSPKSCLRSRMSAAP